ncbi:MAG: nicotinate-nucleotide--dimethylbenzimidazole phosphoribosyltransferase [Candidatus Omnitrophota bacterium]|nr:nicotinate-nucleotide--dimethylbenzimidazole phosphoribosyltransferase [Candidatus Omnitrophota bacterium]
MAKPVQEQLIKEAQKHLDNLTKPIGSLGLLESIALKMSAITGQVKPTLPERKRVYVFAGDHGVVAEGVSAYPAEVTAAMVANFLAGGAAVNVFARHVNAEVLVVDAGVASDLKPEPGLVILKVGKGTGNFTRGPAMTRLEAERSLAYGKKLAQQAVGDKVGLIIVGDMGIGNTTTATAVSVAFGFEVEEILDIGTGIDQEGLKKKKEAVLKAIGLNKPDPNDPIDVLAKVGSYCFGEIAGLILGAAENGIPVVLDGFPTTAAALIAWKIDPKLTDYLFAGHLSAVKGHRILLEAMELEPILNLQMRLGEGTGGVLATFIIEVAIKMACEMATFEEAGVSRGNEKDIE